jgi:hypothetical protein
MLRIVTFTKYSAGVIEKVKELSNKSQVKLLTKSVT